MFSYQESGQAAAFIPDLIVFNMCSLGDVFLNTSTHYTQLTPLPPNLSFPVPFFPQQCKGHSQYVFILSYLYSYRERDTFR